MTKEEIETLAQNLRAKKVCETHTSWVILTGEFAYKIKKPVDFGFLDYTTREKRKRYCLAELKLNRRLAPEIYLGVLGIDKNYRFTEINSPAVIDYAVKMKELPQEALMTSLLKRKKVNFSQVKEIAQIVANFHNGLSQTKNSERYGRLDIIRYNWEENFNQTENFVGKTISRRRYEGIKEKIYSFMEENKELFAQRIREKKIKFCHGDLHSQNIFLLDKPYIFDCIEFNPRFSCSDTASEVAFFLMDLEFANSHHLADYFLDHYLQLTKDFSLLRLLTFYKAYRAYVRGKVISFRLKEKGIGKGERLKIRNLARRYFRESERYTLSLFKKPKVLVFFGPPASGKTTLAEEIRKREEGILLSTDILRKDLLNLPIEEHLPAPFGKGIYQKEITQKTYEELIKRAKEYYLQKRSVFLDGTFSNPYYRDLLRKEIGSSSIFWLLSRAPKRLILKRLRRERKYSDAHPEIYLKMVKAYQSLASLKPIFLNTKRKLRENIRKILSRIKNCE